MTTSEAQARAVALLRQYAGPRAIVDLTAELARIDRSIAVEVHRVREAPASQPGGPMGPAVPTLPSVLRQAATRLAKLESTRRAYLGRLAQLGGNAASPTNTAAEAVAGCLRAAHPDAPLAAAMIRQHEAGRLAEADGRIASLLDTAAQPRGIAAGFPQDDWLDQVAAALVDRARAEKAATAVDDDLADAVELLSS